MMKKRSVLRGGKALLAAILMLALAVTLLPSLTASAAERYTPETCPHAADHARQETDPDRCTPDNSDYLEWGTVYEATCTMPAQREVVCKFCGFTVLQTISGSTRLGHDFGAWTVGKEPTCTELGYEKSVCTRCGETQTRTLAELGHSFGTWTTLQAATCKSSGTEQRVCTRCSKNETRVTDKIDHNYGEWVVTKESVGDEDGVEVRTCTMCGLTDTRYIAAYWVGQGAENLDVLVLQTLLAEYGGFTGEINGVFGRDLTACVKDWQATHGLDPNGVAQLSTFAFLVDELLDDYPGVNMNLSFRSWEETGLKAYYQTTVIAASNGDQTHRAEYTIVGVTFKKDGEEVTFPVGSHAETVLKETESCLLGNEEHTCAVCGDSPKLAFSDYGEGMLAGGFSLLFIPPSGMNPAVSGVGYNPVEWFGSWDAFDGADSYLVELYRETAVDPVVSEVVTDCYWDLIPGIVAGGTGKYTFWVTAMKGDEFISESGGIGFTYADQLPAPTSVTVECLAASWTTAMELPESCYYEVSIYEASDLTHPVSAWETEEIGVDLIPMLKGTEIREYGLDYVVGVCIRSLSENYRDSEICYSEGATYVEPTYYRVTCSCNVRAAASTNSERIGGLRTGDIIAATDVKDGFLQFYYGGRIGWVMMKLCEMTEAQYHTVTFHANAEEINSYSSVITSYDGKIDQSYFTHFATKYENMRPGYAVLRFYDTNGNTVDRDTVFTKDTDVMTEWQMNPDYVKINLYRFDGAYYKSVVAKKGTYYSDVLPEFIDGASVICWKTRMGSELTEDDTIPMSVEWEIDLYSVNASDNWYTLDHDTVVRKTENVLSTIISVLRTGDKIEILNYEDYLDEAVFRIRTKDDIVGYVLAEDLMYKMKEHFITLDPNGGWCMASQLVTDSKSKINISDLPTPERDGYIFAGWKDISGGLELQGDDSIAQWRRNRTLPVGVSGRITVMTDTTLQAQWIECDANTFRKAIIFSFWPEDFYKGLGGSIYDVDWFDAVADYLFVTVIGDVIEHNGKEWYHILAGSGLEGYVQAWMVYLDYEVIELYPGDIKLYNTPTTSMTFFSLHVGESGETVYKIREAEKRIEIIGHLFQEDKWSADYIDKSTVKKDWIHVNFDPNGGTLNGNAVVETRSGRKLYSAEFPWATLAGAEFVGWYTEPIGGRFISSEDTFTTSMTLYAHYRNDAVDYYTPVSDTEVKCYTSTELDNAGYYGILPKGALIEGIPVFKNGHYVAISADYNGKTCYFKTNELYVVEAKTIVYRDVIRNGAKRSAKMVAKIPAGTEILILQEVNGWYEIVWPEAKNGVAYLLISENSFFDS